MECVQEKGDTGHNKLWRRANKLSGQDDGVCFTTTKARSAQLWVMCHGSFEANVMFKGYELNNNNRINDCLAKTMDYI